MERYIKSFANDAAIQDALDNKVLGKPYVALNNQTGEIDWDSKTPTEPKDMYFTIEAISAGTVYLALANGVNMQYSTDNGQTWETNASVNAQPGDKVLYKGINNSLREDGGNGHSRFSGSTASFVVYGNIMSLLYGDNFANQTSFPQEGVQTFEELFANCSGLTDASNLILPATTLVNSCYYRMFQVCRNLTAAPALPATAFTENVEFAYQAMFQGCSSLEIAPDLPIKVLKGYNYNSIFEGCSSLRYIKCLATSWVDDWQTLSWVNGVAATGTFVKAASATWNTGESGIPSGWTVVNA